MSTDRNKFPSLSNAATSNSSLYKSTTERIKKKKLIKKPKKLTYEERVAKQDKEMRDRARARHEQWKIDRKTKGKGNKSYNKGKPKSEWVDSAYERRQKDADKSMRDAARKRHDAFQKKHKRGKYSKGAQQKAAKKQDKKFGVTDKDTSMSKFIKKGGLAGFINRRRKQLKAMSKSDLTLNKR